MPLIICRWSISNFFGTIVFSNCTLLTSLGQAHTGRAKVCKKNQPPACLIPMNLARMWHYIQQRFQEFSSADPASKRVELKCILHFSPRIMILILQFFYLCSFLKTKSRNFQLLKKDLIATRRASEMQNRSAQWQYKRMSCHLRWRSSAMSCNSTWTFRVSF